MNLNDRANSLYGLKQWGKGYFSVNENGELCVLPERLEKSRISLPDVINEVKTQGIELPVVVRFHDILRSEVKNLNTTFNQIIKESGYTGNFFGVYPIKVNQMREVVEEIVDAGAEYKYGLEAGSKAELLSVLALNTTADTLTIANGYKDNDYMKLVLLGRKLGRKVIVVIEKFSDLKKIVELSKEMNIEPMIGLRTKISTKGGGKWSESGGEKAKFGLTHVELLKAVHYLDSQGMRHTIKLLHYHIGSQVPNIQTIKDAVIEATRIYGELHRIGVSIDYLDVGGGLGIDYDGSKSTHFSSINYTNEMYISNIIYGIKDICEEMEVPEPDIVTESGRAISAHHSCIITEAIDKIDHTKHDMPLDPEPDCHHLVKNILDIITDISHDTPLESFNDALSIKSQSEDAFKLGVLSLSEKALIEAGFWRICKILKEKVSEMEYIPEDFKDFNVQLSTQYLCNFSVFQSLPDTWAVEQLTPIMPIARLNETPTEHATLVDITCDSDGKIDRFVGNKGNKQTIKLHDLIEGEPYHIGFFLTGAYQDVMGDMHNLFGRVNEVHVFNDEEDDSNFYIEEVIKGSSASKVLASMQYHPEHMAYVIKRQLDDLVSKRELSPREGVRLIDFYEDCLESYTYLKSSQRSL